MIQDLAASLSSPISYRRFAGERGARTAGYVAFLSLIFVGALGVALKLRLAPLFDETFQWLKTQMPVLHVVTGSVTSDPPGPVRIEHPRLKEIAVMIDTTRKDPVTPQMMADAKALAYLTNNAVYLNRNGRMETFDLTKTQTEKPVTVDASTYEEMQHAFNWIFYPSILLLFFLIFAISLAFFGLLYGLVGMIFSSLSNASLGFGALYRLAIHAQTAGALLRCLDTVLPRSIPFSGLMSLAMSLVYLWLGVRAAAHSAEPELPAAA